MEAVSVIADKQFHCMMQTVGTRAASVAGPWLAASQLNFNFTMQTPGLRAASVGGPWLAASQSNTLIFYHICPFWWYDGLYGQVLVRDIFAFSTLRRRFPRAGFYRRVLVRLAPQPGPQRARKLYSRRNDSSRTCT